MELTLYYSNYCPYCIKVLQFMKENNIEVSMKDTDEDFAYRDELIDIGGKPQIPCLIIDGKAMYESDDIIDWLQENYK